MKIYLAALYHSRVAIPGSGSIHLRVTEKIRYPHILESFAYTSGRMMRLIRHNKQKIFLDSGAFTMHTQNIRVSMVEYANFIRDNHDLIELASNLDVIGPGNEQRSYDRLKTLQQLLAYDGLAHLVKPVHHVLDRDCWLERHLDEGYEYIFLGGMVDETTKLVRTWLDHVFTKYLTTPDGTPKLKVHGFGMTTASLMARYPWHSIDSRSWKFVTKRGGVWLDFPRADGSFKDFMIVFADYGYGGRRYGDLVPVDRRAVDRRLKQLEAERIRDPEIEATFRAELGCRMGFNPEALSKSYGLRDLANIGYYQRAMDRAAERFVRDRPKTSRVCP